MRVPPNNQDYERSILASIMIDPEALELVVDILNPDDFYVTKHRQIYAAACALYHEQSPVDLPTIAEKLTQSKQLSDVGAGFLAQIVDVPMATNVEWYARKIKEKAGLRRVIEVCNAATKRAFTQEEDAIEIIDRFQNDIHSISMTVGRENNYSMAELVKESFDQYQSLHIESDGVTGLPSGFFQWDYLSCGFQDTDLNILAARPSMGKTALALNITKHAASQGYPVQWFSLEMSKRQLRDRLMASEAMVNGQKFRSGGFTTAEMKRIESAQAVLYQYPIFIDDDAGLNHMEIRRRARRYQRTNDIRLIIIDHLQLVGSTPTENRNDELGIYTRAFKAMAKELDLPVIVLSQLNRNLENRPDKTPRLSDLRESGNIEQDADNVYFIHRPGKYPDQTEDYPNQALILASKQRNGPTGIVQLEWIEKFQEFRTYDNRYGTSQFHQTEAYRRDIHD